MASRRRADELIAAGCVRVNGAVVRELGSVVSVEDRVEVSGKAVGPPAQSTYLLLNKPAGVVTTLRDPQGRRTVAAFIEGRPRLFPVGRLDYDTAGALLLTDDGSLAHSLLHPRFRVDKVYRATIAGRLSPEDVARLRSGLVLNDGATQGTRVRVVAVRRNESVVDVTIHEGRNRQVRRMFAALGHGVMALTRTRFGPVSLGDLPLGAVRPLTEKERTAIAKYRRLSGEAPRTMRA